MFYYFDEQDYCYKICTPEDIGDNSKKFEDEEGVGNLNQKYDFKNKCWLDEFKVENNTLKNDLSNEDILIRELNKIYKELENIKGGIYDK